MEILVETTRRDLYVLLFKKFRVIDRVLIENLREKSDHLPVVFEKLLSNNNLMVGDVQSFYATTGPGSFMGIRAGLLFIQTLAATLGKKLYVCNTLHFLQTRRGQKVFIDARGGYFYSLQNQTPRLKKGAVPETLANYNFIENNLALVLAKFKEASAFANNAVYVKKPRIG